MSRIVGGTLRLLVCAGRRVCDRAVLVPPGVHDVPWAGAVPARAWCIRRRMTSPWAMRKRSSSRLLPARMGTVPSLAQRAHGARARTHAARRTMTTATARSCRAAREPAGRHGPADRSGHPVAAHRLPHRRPGPVRRLLRRRHPRPRAQRRRGRAGQGIPEPGADGPARLCGAARSGWLRLACSAPGCSS